MNPLRKYEGLFIFPTQEAAEALKAQEKRLEEMVRRFGGHTLEHRDWGRRTLGFPVRRAREGRFVVWNFEMEPARIGEFRKAVELEESLLKATLVRPPEPRPVKEKAKKRTPSLEKGRESEKNRQPSEMKEEVRGSQP